MAKRKAILCLTGVWLLLFVGSMAGQSSVPDVKDALNSGKISIRVDAVSGGKELAVKVSSSGDETTRMLIPKGTTTFALDLGSTVRFSFSLVASDAVQIEVAPRRDFAITFTQAQEAGIASGGMNLENREGKTVALLEPGLTLITKGAKVTIQKAISVLVK